MTTYVYIDGFNLYYAALKNSPHKWLDIVRFSQSILPKADIQAVRYYTARVSARPDDPDQPVRQDTYLQAIANLPGVTIHEGHFLASTTRARMTTPPAGGPNTVEVHKTEEKGSDVNLATHLLVDGFRNRYSRALVVTNDSDFAEPIRVVRNELGLSVVVANPSSRRPSRQLALVAEYVKNVRRSMLALNQLPDPVRRSDGRLLHKPRGW